MERLYDGRCDPAEAEENPQWHKGNRPDNRAARGVCDDALETQQEAKGDENQPKCSHRAQPCQAQAETVGGICRHDGSAVYKVSVVQMPEPGWDEVETHLS